MTTVPPGAGAQVGPSSGQQLDDTASWTSDVLPGSRPIGWVDRLVELHILAEHGCVASVEEARRWLASDGDARRVWEDVQRVCDQIGDRAHVR